MGYIYAYGNKTSNKLHPIWELSYSMEVTVFILFSELIALYFFSMLVRYIYISCIYIFLYSIQNLLFSLIVLKAKLAAMFGFILTALCFYIGVFISNGFGHTIKSFVSISNYYIFHLFF